MIELSKPGVLILIAIKKSYVAASAPKRNLKCADSECVAMVPALFIKRDQLLAHQSTSLLSIKLEIPK